MIKLSTAVILMLDGATPLDAAVSRLVYFGATKGKNEANMRIKMNTLTTKTKSLR